MKSPANSPRPAPKGKKLGKVMWTNPADDGITSIRLYAIKSGADSCNEPSHTHPVLVFDLRDYPEAVERVATYLARMKWLKWRSSRWSARDLSEPVFDQDGNRDMDVWLPGVQEQIRGQARVVLAALNWPAPTKGEGK